MRRQRKVLGAVCPSQTGQQARGAPAAHKERALVPRSSSPVTVYVELPCVFEQAFPTIAWNDLEDCASVARRDTDSLGSQVTGSDADDQDFADYALDFIADSPATLESSLSPAELVPFQGCVIPPLTPQRFLSPEEGPPASSTAETPPPDGDPWRDISNRMLGHSLEVNTQLHDTLHKKQEEIDSLQERNLHLRQLACRAKHLAAVLEKLMTVRDPGAVDPARPCGDKAPSPCKRQRLDDGRRDSVEDMLRDVSTRCNAVLHGSQPPPAAEADSDTVRVYGSFSGLHTVIREDCGGAKGEDGASAFRASVGQHGTVRTQTFPHGRAFTACTQQGGYRFRWVPNQS